MVQFKVLDRIVNVDKEITELDKFTINVLDIVKKHTDYVIISGYVSIFFGRARATEDIDIFIRKIPFEKFKELYSEFIQKGYEWTIDEPKELYENYLQKNTPISVWQKDFPLLRVEIKIATKPSQLIALQERIIVKFKGHELFMSNIESQIAYKRYIAKSEKDLADARHLEIAFQVSQEKIQEYRKLFEAEWKKE